MKIVIVDTTVHGLSIGGGHLFLPGLMKGLIQKGHEVHLVVEDTPNEKIAPLIKNSNAMVHKKPWKKSGLIEDTAPLFAEWVNKLDPDIYMISASGDIGWVALPLLDPAIATLTIGHNDLETFYLPARHYHSFLTRAIGVSHEICNHYITDCNVPAERVEWIPYGVAVSTETPVSNNTSTLQIVYVGRIIEEQKRISDLVAITKSLSAGKIDFKLIIIGDGPDMPKVKTMLQQEISDGKVILTGWLTNPEIINILRRSEVFVLTSAYEGFCIALIEAMANGCCPVVTDIRSGNKYLVKDPVNGFVIEVGNTEKFAANLAKLAGDKQLLNQMRVQAWNEGRQYSTTTMADNYEKCFYNVSAEAKKNLRKPDASFPLMITCRSKYPKWLRSLKVMAKGG